jgi:hypothetical protein
MPYVLIYRMGGLVYYLQKYNGEHRFNGLVDNAVEYKNELYE